MIKGLTFHITEDRVLFSFSSSLVCTETDLTGGLKEPPTHSLTDSLIEIVSEVAEGRHLSASPTVTAVSRIDCVLRVFTL